jgi:hypothetical protein
MRRPLEAATTPVVKPHAVGAPALPGAPDRTGARVTIPAKMDSPIGSEGKASAFNLRARWLPLIHVRPRLRYIAP